jgi:hypothetical protein
VKAPISDLDGFGIRGRSGKTRLSKALINVTTQPHQLHQLHQRKKKSQFLAKIQKKHRVNSKCSSSVLWFCSLFGIFKIRFPSTESHTSIQEAWIRDDTMKAKYVGGISLIG